MMRGTMTGLISRHRQKLLATLVISAVITPIVLLSPAGIDNSGTGLSVIMIVSLLGAVLFGATVKGVTGMGFGLITAPFAASVIDAQIAFVILSIPTFVMCLFQIIETGTASVFLRDEPAVVLTALIGSALGVYLLGSVSTTSILSVGLAVVLLFYVSHQTVHGFVPVESSENPYLKVLASTSHGLTFGAFNLGPLFPAYLHSYERNLDRYIGGVAILTALILGEKIVLMLAAGLLGPGLVWYGSAITLVAIVGIGIGSLLRHRINEAVVHRGIVALVTLAAVSLLREPVSSFL